MFRFQATPEIIPNRKCKVDSFRLVFLNIETRSASSKVAKRSRLNVSVEKMQDSPVQIRKCKRLCCSDASMPEHSLFILPRNITQPLGEVPPKHYFHRAKSKPDTQARVAELADAQDLKSCDLTVVRVQVPPRVLEKIGLSA